MCVSSQRRELMVRCKVTDVLDVVCGSEKHGVGLGAKQINMPV